ncbi:L-histidine N(alpha)-methyltransferase [Granulicella sibirica]|uniref:ABC transporter ATP-binding protein n=1 Tax=Granulicella sibirica TaxID=2479048 RepID=A0A4Q0T1N4_9BACT|nr:L-histidine N(alpha)-methyltransferase [Granulicella sibirica]RXH57077.1 ABC transporter ATP-binding protein [Granulicella sibirica]
MPVAEALSVLQAVANEARQGLSSTPKTLSPWLFYDEAGSELFEQITTLPEYYLTRTERSILTAHAADILEAMGNQPITIAELGAGTATKTGILLRAATKRQPELLYQPIDVSPTCLEEARDSLESSIPGLTVRPQLANYITEPIHIDRPAGTAILALYIGSSIGNFSPSEAKAILTNLRTQLEPGDALLLGTDLAPGPNKSVNTLISAYDDAQGVTAAFNRNILARLNRDLQANFHETCFRHEARWNAAASRIEMHLAARSTQTVSIPTNSTGPSQTIHFAKGETIHTENSHKFTAAAISALLESSGFSPTRTFQDPQSLFAVTFSKAT